MFQPGASRQEAHQRTGPLGEDEAVQPLVARQLRMAADHVAHVFLGEFVVAQVDGGKAVADEVARDAFGLVLAW